MDGKPTEIDPIAAMLNPASFHEVLHMTLAALVATGFSVAAVHAFFLLRQRTNEFHRSALAIALIVGCVATPLHILSGDLSARTVAKLQPAKLAAMEAHYHTSNGAPLIVGGLADVNVYPRRLVPGAIFASHRTGCDLAKQRGARGDSPPSGHRAVRWRAPASAFAFFSLSGFQRSRKALNVAP
ncbi:MAG: cytochrome ubiquinol oxidase subunit I [Verrucomicrobiota bacterium]|nr:cytochrome ubiquinol oxidase subunit I [Verrucomicrobiota bacterium]